MTGDTGQVHASAEGSGGKRGQLGPVSEARRREGARGERRREGQTGAGRGAWWGTWLRQMAQKECWRTGSSGPGRTRFKGGEVSSCRGRPPVRVPPRRLATAVAPRVGRGRGGARAGRRSAHQKYLLGWDRTLSHHGRAFRLDPARMRRLD